MSNFKLEIKKDTSTIGVTQPTEEDLDTKLNRLAHECGFNNIHTRALTFIRGDNVPNGVQLIFQNPPDGSFVLNAPVSGFIREYNVTEGRHQVPAEFTGLVAIKRILVGYAACSRINTAIEMQRVMGPLINEAIKDFMDEVGNIGFGYTLTAKQPGIENRYFRDLEDIAAMEFRLCLIKN